MLKELKEMESKSRRILVTDDQPEILEDYRRILCPADNRSREKELASLEAELFGEPQAGPEPAFMQNYSLVTASQGEEAISMVRQSLVDNNPITVAFLDIRMPPGINGVQAACEIRKLDQDIEIVFVTAYSDISQAEINKLFGPSSKLLYLRKPFDADEIKQLALTLTEKWNLEQGIRKKTDELRLTHSVTIRSLAELAELRDTDTGNHLKRVCFYSKLIARKLGERHEPKWCQYITNIYVEDLGESSVLHDIGKIGIPDTILLKPGNLTTEEFELMKTHTTIGGDALAKADQEMGFQSFLTLAREIAYHHHEKFDGTGYPKGLKGEEIPLSARIVALADVYDALTSNRPYRKALPHETAFKIITREMGRNHFDPMILEIFCQYKDEFNRIRAQSE